MHTLDHERFAAAAVKKSALAANGLGRYLLLSVLAGAYVGFGIALICSLGGPLAAAGSPAVKLVMGASFGIALTLVIFAGSELFTGNTMIGVIGGLARSVSWRQVLQFNFWSWVGNLIGSLAFAWLVAVFCVLDLALFPIPLFNNPAAYAVMKGGHEHIRHVSDICWVLPAP